MKDLVAEAPRVLDCAVPSEQLEAKASPRPATQESDEPTVGAPPIPRPVRPRNRLDSPECEPGDFPRQCVSVCCQPPGGSNPPIRWAACSNRSRPPPPLVPLTQRPTSPLRAPLSPEDVPPGELAFRRAASLDSPPISPTRWPFRNPAPLRRAHGRRRK